MFDDSIFYPITACFPLASLESFCLIIHIYCKCQDGFYLFLTKDQLDYFLSNYQDVCKSDVDIKIQPLIAQNSAVVRIVELTC